MQTPINDIHIKPDRQRRDFNQNELDKLSESMRTVGQIHPIVIDDDSTLVAGERRIRAAQQLGWTHIETVLRTDLDDWTREVIELEENLRREDLSYADELRAIRRLHDMYQTKHGRSSESGGRGRSQGWKVRDTAELLGISVGAASQDLQLATAIEKDPELAKQRSKVAARSMMQRKQAVRARQLVSILSAKPKDQLGETGETAQSGPVEPTAPTPDIQLVNDDARTALQALQDDSIACLVTDPPWQVRFDDAFGSDPKTGLDLTRDVLTALYPKLQDGALCWMFCATKHLIKGTIWDLVQSCGYALYEQVLLWCKPTIAHSSHPYREVKNDYEPCVVFSKGRARDFTKPIFAVQTYKLDERKLHEAQKPWRLLKLLVETSTVEGELVADPFAGSGQTLLACKASGRRAWGCELDPDHYSLAQGNLAYWKEDNA